MRQKFLFVLLFCLVVVANLTYAQTSTWASGHRVAAAKKQIDQNNQATYSSSAYDYGSGPDPNNIRTIHRGVYKVVIPAALPSDAEIYSIKLSYSTTTTSSSFIIYSVSEISTSSTSQQFYDHAASGANLSQCSGSLSTTTIDLPSSFAQQVTSALSGGNRNIFLGITSSDEYNVYPFTYFNSFQLDFYYHRSVNFTINNNFGAGLLQVNGNNLNSGSVVNSHETKTVTLGAVEPQTSSSITYLWNDSEAPSNKSNWERKKSGASVDKGTTQSISPTMSYNYDNGSQYVANMRKLCNVNFQNSFVGLSSRGTMTINGNSVTLPTAAYEVVEENTINASATYYQENGINYYFRRWEDNSTDPNRTLTINQNSVTATAYFEGIPSTANRNLTHETVVGQPITLNWSEHPNTYVTKYAIWRKVKNGPAGSVIAEVNRGTTTFVDTDYSYVASNAPVTLQYDVMPYYSLENTYSYSDWLTIGGEFLPKKNENERNASSIPTSYSISNHPNPFNPATTINYQLPQDGMVTIKVYDIIGKEVATLVNEQKSAGYYKVDFDASKLTSGVYIATIQASGFNKSIKLLLTK